MNSRERVGRTLRHKTPDRVPLTGGFSPQVWAKLREHFKVESEEQVREKLGMDPRGEVMGPSLGFQRGPLS